MLYTDIDNFYWRRLFELFDEYIEQCVRDNVESFVNSYIEASGQNYELYKLKMILRDLMGAGTDTTKETMSWTIVYLANHPQWQKRLREQVSTVIVFLWRT
jgi:cytochrome P450